MRRASLGMTVAALVFAVACGGERPRTQVMLIVDADARVRAETTTLSIEIRGRAAGASAWAGDFDRSFVVAETGWPIEVAIVPASDDASREWRATVRALGASGGARLEARAIGTFVPEQTLAHRVVLEGACVDAATCDDDQTCGATGVCVSARVPPGALVPYTPPGATDAGILLDAEAPADAAPDAQTDAGPPCVPARTNLDVVLMIDNSNSMAEEQASLTQALPTFVTALSTGDVTGDGVRDVAPIDSLRIGVITSDMGTGAVPVVTCMDGHFGSMLGDDGVLLATARAGAGTCAVAYPPVFQYARGTDDVSAFASNVACVAAAGIRGCGFEQQLEATLKAIAPRIAQPWTAAGYTPLTFLGDTFGHGSDANADLFRDDSILLVLLLTDEEDCSAADPGIFDPASTTYTGDLNLRCFENPEALHGLARYVDGLLSMRRDPQQLVYAGIVGIPVDTEPDSLALDYEAVLDHPAMIEEVDPMMTTRVRPSCNVPGRGLAFPPRRIVSVARDLEAAGAATAIHSICQADYQPAIRNIARLVGERLEGTCR